MRKKHFAKKIADKNTCGKQQKPIAKQKNLQKKSPFPKKNFQNTHTNFFKTKHKKARKTKQNKTPCKKKARKNISEQENKLAKETKTKTIF